MNSTYSGPSDPLWYKDAVIYEVHIKAFCDVDGDGIGDFSGFTTKLDYLRDLGVTAIWLLPFYPSPLRDDGYDIAEYMDIHPDYGDMETFKTFIDEAHALGLYVITELVINHTSDRHPWFTRARHAPPGSPERDFYVWSDTSDKYLKARIIFKDFEASNWSWDPIAKAYYWHRFYAHQPDLNFENPAVREKIFDVIDFWLDLGVDGMRLDAVPYLFESEDSNCENLPETIDYLKTLRAHVDEKYQNRMLLAEANQWPEDAAKYFGDGDVCHMCFHFPLMPRMFMALEMEDRFPIIDILEQTPPLPGNCQWAVFLRNHDELTLEMVTDEERDYMYRMYALDKRARINLGIRRRLAPLLDNDRRKIELMDVLLMTMPGSPVIYYGDEIGMGDNFYLGDRDGVRTPMQWSDEKNAGFSKANPQGLFLPVVIDPEYHYQAVNVEAQQQNSASLLWWIKRLVAMRKRYRAFGHGDMTFVSSDNHHILAYLRKMEEEVLLIVVNLCRAPQAVRLDLAEYAGRLPVETTGKTVFPEIESSPYFLTMNGHGYFIFELADSKDAPRRQVVDTPSITIHGGVFLDVGVKHDLARHVLPNYLASKGLMPGRAGRFLRAEILETLPAGDADHPAWLVIVEANYTDGPSDTFNLFLSYERGKNTGLLEREEKGRIVCTVVGDDETDGVILEGPILAGGSAGHHQGLFTLAATRQIIKGRSGEFRSLPGKHSTVLGEQAGEHTAPEIREAATKDMLFAYDDKVMLKIYRRTAEGNNPDVETVRHLTEKGDFPHAPSYLGSVVYKKAGRSEMALGLFTTSYHSETTARHKYINHLTEFAERTLAWRNAGRPAPFAGMNLCDAGPSEFPEEERELLPGNHIAMCETLGEQAAVMHMALAKDYGDPEFTPEPFGFLARRSAYQGLRARIVRAFDGMRHVHVTDDADLTLLIAELNKRSIDVQELMDRFLRQAPECWKIRVHGCFVLDRIVFTGREFLFTDFDGPEGSSLSMARLKRLPSSDLVDMLHCFYETAIETLADDSMVRPDDRPIFEPYVRSFAVASSAVLLRAYFKRMEEADFFPQFDQATIFLEVGLLERLAVSLTNALKKGTIMAGPLGRTLLSLFNVSLSETTRSE
ncbi:maltose alpha-D-glucosyltransferase [Desulfovibrio inopinatus]|uniref:maltose alpha-D-glucosyltransferase n=1 Tax=Desulfovibrio inopinatus TaxID=102109 RepID=UPI00042992F3|nr:maltose alpha-D-glucosyltransferase [Desulfovibrio inopinatus]